MKSSWLFIHGGWGGSWQWTPVSSYFKSLGISSFTPNMPGMGEEQGTQINLDYFVDHASEIIENHHGPINIAAFSFGGLTATALAGKYYKRIKKLVYIDAFIPRPGQSFSDIAGEKITRQIKAYTDVMGENNMIPPFFETDPRYCSHPLNTLFTNVTYVEKNLTNLKPLYIECTAKDPDWAFTHLLEETAKETKRRKWKFQTLKSDHMPMFSHTEDLCRLLLD